MAEASQKRPSRRRSRVAFALGVAAAAACWNPFAAPFGLLVGLAAVVLSARALRGSSERKRLAVAALALGLLATVASVAVVASTAGVVGVDLPGEPVVKGRTQEELEQVLSQSAERTRARRERAEHELELLGSSGDAGAATGKARRDGGAPARGAAQR